MVDVNLSTSQNLAGRVNAAGRPFFNPCGVLGGYSKIEWCGVQQDFEINPQDVPD